MYMWYTEKDYIYKGISPTYSIYDVKKMREHLVHCLKIGKLQPFPKILKDKAKRQRKLLESIDVVYV